ncbi:unnamed protein product [Orchesella dallaii]|uniref:Gustatory receptor n=1 Tax=Orchesella dallaii TaxID=48710 RepID=A0ABP1R221_9HEXA
MGLCPSFLFQKSIIKSTIILWNILIFLFNLMWWILDLHRIKVGLSIGFGQLGGGMLVNVTLNLGSFLFLTILLGLRLWMWQNEFHERSSGDSTFIKTLRNFQNISEKYKEIGTKRLTSFSLNELVFVAIILLSTIRHTFSTYIRNSLFILHNYKPEPNIWSFEVEFSLRYGKAIQLDSCPLDSIGLLCVFLMQFIENSIEYLNLKLEQNLMSLQHLNLQKLQRHHHQIHDDCSHQFSQRHNHVDPVPEALSKHLIFMEYKTMNTFTIKECFQLFELLVKTWEGVKKITSLLIFICFGMWMQNFCFFCFYSYAASIDLGPLHLLTFTFHFVVLSNVAKYICTANGVQGLEYQTDKLNKLLLRILTLCTTVDTDDNDQEDYHDGDDSLCASQDCEHEYHDRKTNNMTDDIKITSENTRLISHIYDLNSCKNPLVLRICGWHTFNRATVLAVLGTAVTYLVVLLQFRLSPDPSH